MYTPTPSYIETRFLDFWTRLNIHYHLTPQYPIGPYFVDYAHIPSRTVIELDGLKFHSSPEQLAYDTRRQKYIEKQGWKVIRFSGKEVYHHPVQCVYRAKNLIQS